MRHWSRKFSVGLLVIGLLVVAKTVAGAPIRLFTEEYAPYASKNHKGQLTGISTDIVNELMRRAKVEAAAPVILPWARAIFTTLHVPNTCLFSTARTVERESKFRWVGPIGQLDIVLFARTASNIRIPNLQAARPYRIGSYIGNASVAILSASGLKVEETSSDQANPKKLLLGRIDLWAVGRVPGLELMRNLNIKEIEQVFVVDSSDLYLACNVNMKQDEENRLNEVLGDMYRDNTVRSIYERYGYGGDTPLTGKRQAE